MTIKFELPSDDALVLKHFGTALTNIAAELRGENPKPTVTYTKPVEVQPETTEQQYASLAEDGANVEAPVDTVEPVADDTPPPPPVQDVPKSETVTDVVDEGELQEDRVEGVELDGNGLPWDGRIHSANKSRNADNSWRNRRQAKDDNRTIDEWKQYISTVEAEFKCAMSGETVADDTPPPPPVVDAEPTPFDQAVTADVPPPPPSDVPERKFPELMKLVTSNLDKGSVAKVQQILSNINIANLPTLKTARPDMVPTVYAKLSDQLGD